MEQNREFRELVQKEKEKLAKEEIFESAFYKQLLLSVAFEITGGTLKQVELKKEPESPWAGKCSEKQVFLNLLNSITASFPTLPLKSDSLFGILGHECGHWNFSDFSLRKGYLDGLEEGRWYQLPPQPKTPEEEEHLKEINHYLKEKNPIALALLSETASFLQNMLEDVYVEQKMCRWYPGSIKRGILQNRVRRAEMVPSLKAQLERGYEPVSVLLNLMAQYSMTGTVNNWEEKTGELLELLEAAKPVINFAVVVEDARLRMAAANRILLIIWNLLAEKIREMDKKPQEEPKKEPQEKRESDSDGQRDSDSNGQAEHHSQQEAQKSSPTGQPVSKSDPTEEEEGNPVEPQTEEAAQEKRERMPDAEPGQDVQGALEQMLERIREQLPSFLLKKDPEAVMGNPKKKIGRNDLQKNQEMEEGQEMEPGDLLMEHIQKLAEKNAQKEMDMRVRLELAKELLETAFDGDHRKVKKVLIRETEITPEAMRRYRTYEEEVKSIMRRMKPRLLPVLSCQGSHMERHLFFGPRMDFQALYDPGKRIYRNQEIVRKVNTAVALLIDLSGSMSGERIEQARLCALCLYEFCHSAGIPILIYGHHIDKKHRRVQEETVFLHSFAEFDPDRNDRYRISSMDVRGCNRDGAALCFVGEKLAKRPEKIKLLFSISDGLPNATHYCGQRAEEDLLHIKESLEKKRITVLTAAIGSDKEAIQRIYKEGFLDISDIEQLPFLLPKQIMARIKR